MHLELWIQSCSRTCAVREHPVREIYFNGTAALLIFVKDDQNGFIARVFNNIVIRVDVIIRINVRSKPNMRRPAKKRISGFESRFSFLRVKIFEAVSTVCLQSILFPCAFFNSTSEFLKYVDISIAHETHDFQTRAVEGIKNTTRFREQKSYLQKRFGHFDGSTINIQHGKLGPTNQTGEIPAGTIEMSNAIFLGCNFKYHLLTLTVNVGVSRYQTKPKHSSEIGSSYRLTKQGKIDQSPISRTPYSNDKEHSLPQAVLSNSTTERTRQSGSIGQVVVRLHLRLHCQCRMQNSTESHYPTEEIVEDYGLPIRHLYIHEFNCYFMPAECGS